ncbi:MAG: hypothetical protein ACN6OP_16650, partial [Pseudomonadales bacterium]
CWRITARRRTLGVRWCEGWRSWPGGGEGLCSDLARTTTFGIGSLCTISPNFIGEWLWFKYWPS